MSFEGVLYYEINTILSKLEAFMQTTKDMYSYDFE